MSNPITPALIQAHLLLASINAEQTTLLTGIASAVRSAIEQETCRAFESAAYTEAYDGNGRASLYLRHDPILTVTSITMDGSALTVGAGTAPVYPPVQCVWDGDTKRIGCIRLTDGSAFTLGSQNVIVTYTAGWGTAPDALVRAGVLWAAHLFTAGRFPSQQNSNVAALGDRPKVISAMIAPFRKPWGVS